jgi:hypothetical protein
VHDNDYGSDHKPIALSFSGVAPRESPRRRKRLYRNADWEKIREVIGSKLGDSRYIKTITDNATLDRVAGILVNGINGVLEEHVSRAKESPYAKRWWSKELSILRTDFTVKRNRITTLRRRDEDTTRAREIASAARRTYLDEIDRQKKQHWKEFLDDPQNIWKAASYAKPSGATIDVPELVVGAQRYQSDKEKAGILMDTFFPTPPTPETSEDDNADASRQDQTLE